tara:strand:+ start:315 stop:740 length:426 start_codon:yes stop_codon:yes gene_type:complete
MAENDERKLPEFRDPQSVEDWARPIEEHFRYNRKHGHLGDMVMGILSESNQYHYTYNRGQQEAMNTLIDAVDQYAKDPDSNELQENFLDALSRTPARGTEMFSFARNRTLEQAAKAATKNIMKAITNTDENDDGGIPPFEM